MPSRETPSETPVEANARVRGSLEEALVPIITEQLSRAHAGAPSAAVIAPSIVGLLTIAALLNATKINRLSPTKTTLPIVPKSVDLDALPIEYDATDLVPAYALADDITDWAADRVANGRPDTLDENWTRHASRSAATRLMSDAQELAAKTIAHASQAPDVGISGTLPAMSDVDLAELGWQRVWISHGDSAVRPLHRRLHGISAKPHVPFWRWPSKGEELMHPGDHNAPISEWIGCRCTEFYVPADVKPAAVVDAFAPADEDLNFRLVASARPGSDRRALSEFIAERVEAAVKRNHPSVYRPRDADA